MRCRCRPPPRTPALISGSANRARSDAMITSQHATSAKPAPTAAPLMAPITGSGQSLSAQKQSRTMLPGSSRSTMLSPSPSSRPCRRAESCRSTPPQNARSPGAVKIATCASVPCRSSVNARSISRKACALSAFTGGRSKVTVAIRSSISTVTYSIAALSISHAPSSGWSPRPPRWVHRCSGRARRARRRPGSSIRRATGRRARRTARRRWHRAGGPSPSSPRSG